MRAIQKRLDIEVKQRNNSSELSSDKPDPLFIARQYKDEYIILLCALYAYGKASLIVRFLEKLDFSLLNESDEIIKKELSSSYYRFQNASDVAQSFISFKRLKHKASLNDIFLGAYKKDASVLEGIDAIITAIADVSDYKSQGYTFLVSKNFKRDKIGNIKEIGNGAYKRWNMYLRWMVRKDELDLGLWKGVDTKDLILPLDTHTFKVSQKLGLLTRKTYDLKSALEITESLRAFDKKDPIKYDFALYRLGQEQIV